MSGLRSHGVDAATESPLTLRVFRAGPGDNGHRELNFLQDFPAQGGWHEGFVSLDLPGGSVAAALGYFDTRHCFQTLVSTLPVVMPESPARPVRTAAPRAIETAALHPAPAPARAMPVVDRRTPPVDDVLDEAAILEAAGIDAQLPLELRSLAREPLALDAGVHPDALHAPAQPPPETPSLVEREVVLRVLRDATNGHALESTQSAAPLREEVERAAIEASAPSSHHLASQFDSTSDSAPVRLEATLVLTGRLLAGHRLRIGNSEIVPKPGGAFTCRHRLNAFESAWSLLLHAISTCEASDAPSIELLARVPDAQAPLSLHSCVEIEGELRDPDYVRHLPAGVVVNPAGRFRIVRALPAAALFLPNLVLVADPGANH